jgi:Gpi18-like mannosyltransferase
MARVWSGERAALLLSLAGALALRVAAIVAGAGYPFDVVTFQRWAERLANGGPPSFYDPAQFADYPPGFLYLLWPLAAWPGGPPAWLLRAVSIPFDLAIAVAIFAVVARLRRPRDGVIAASVYSLNPAVALAGPFWGQVDAVALLPLLLALVAYASGRYALAGILAAVAALSKPQAAIALGIILVAGAAAVVKRREWRPLLVPAGAAFGTAVLLWLPFVPTLEKVGAFIRDATTPHPFSSLFAFNAWALATGFAISDDTLFLGVPMWLWGLLLVAAGLALVVARLVALVPSRGSPFVFDHELAVLLAMTTLAALAVYELPTRIHERYLVTVLPLLAPFVVASRRAGVAYAIFSIVLAVSILFSFTHQDQTRVPAPELVERTLFDPSLIVLLILAGLGAAFALAIAWARREPEIR